MKKDGFIAEVFNAIVQHNRRKIKEGRIDYYFNQKKQLWYLLMNAVDGDPEPATKPDTQPEEPSDEKA